MAQKNILPFSIRADVRSETADDETRSVEMTWTTGAPVKRWDWDIGDFYEELSLDPKHVRMDRLQSGRAPLLANHSSRSLNDVIGVVEKAGVGSATVRFAKGDEQADAAWNKVKQGVLRNVSVGYRVHKFEKQAGGEGKIPTYRATDWEPYEVSIVPMGADAGAQLRESPDLHPCEFITRGTAPQERQHMEPKNDAPAPAAPVVDEARIRAEAQAAERLRIASIQQACRADKTLTAADIQKFVDAGTSAEEVRALVLERLAVASEKSPTTPQIGTGIQVGTEDREQAMRGAEAALFQRYGLTDVAQRILDRAKVKHVPVEARKAFESVPMDGGGHFRAMSLAQIASDFLERRGVNTRRLSDGQVIDKAMTYRSGGENTISDFSVLLQNIMYKTSLGQYTLADDTWREWVRVDTVQDFRPSNRFRIGTFGVLDLLPEGEEYKHKSIPDGLKQSITTQTKGNMLTLSRQAIVNDDMGAIMATAAEYGRAAALSIEVDAYALLNSNSGLGPTFGSHPFFDDTNANINDTGSALGVDALEADRQVFVKQKDISSNEFLGLGKRGNMVLLVPAGLEMQAERLNTMPYDSLTASKFELPNYARGYFRKVVSSPRLTDAARRYLFDMSQNAGAFVCAFLNGLQTPYLEEKLGWNIDGITWKLRIDYQVQAFDPKLAVTNAGA